MTKEDKWDRLADFMTEGTITPAQKTLVTCREQAEFYYAYRNLGKEPGLNFFTEEAELDMEICMSIGKVGVPRSAQIVEMFRSIEEDEHREAGLQPATAYNRARREGWKEKK